MLLVPGVNIPYLSLYYLERTGSFTLFVYCCIVIGVLCLFFVVPLVWMWSVFVVYLGYICFI